MTLWKTRLVRRRTAVGIVRHLAGLPHRVGRAAALRDLDAWLRLQFLGVASRSGLARALVGKPGTAREVAGSAGLSEVELVESLLRLGVALGEVRERNGRFSAKGRRLEAIASGDADDVAGLVEELIVYDGPIDQRLKAHLEGAPRSNYLDGVGNVIARASRLAEHVVGPFLAALAEDCAPATVLDVGCGTGVNLRWIAAASPNAHLTGVDVDADALHEAERNVHDWSLAGRCRLEVADVTDLPDNLRRRYDLVVLAQNIYYWPPEDRAGVMRLLRQLSSGHVVVVTAVPGRLPIVRHLDLALRVTEHSWRLPTRVELRSDAMAAGFRDIRLHTVAPGTDTVALLAS